MTFETKDSREKIDRIDIMVNDIKSPPSLKIMRSEKSINSDYKKVVNNAVKSS